MLQEFSRSALLLGENGMERLARAHVAVFGVGGVGAAAVGTPQEIAANPDSITGRYL